MDGNEGMMLMVWRRLHCLPHSTHMACRMQHDMHKPCVYVGGGCTYATLYVVVVVIVIAGHAFAKAATAAAQIAGLTCIIVLFILQLLQ